MGKNKKRREEKGRRTLEAQETWVTYGSWDWCEGEIEKELKVSLGVDQISVQLFEVAEGQSEKLRGVTEVTNLDGKEGILERKVNKNWQNQEIT